MTGDVVVCNVDTVYPQAKNDVCMLPGSTHAVTVVVAVSFVCFCGPGRGEVSPLNPHFSLHLFFEQEALAYGEEGMLALQEALERTVDAAKGLLERAEAAAAEAEGGEVGANVYL